MSVMRLAAAKGTVLRIVADGSDSEQAVASLTELIDGGFGEMAEDGPKA
jgi:phosphotransferase system HPr-like phosphotransfer protein